MNAIDRTTPTDVLLVCMPFGPGVLQPSLALSLLKAELAPLGVSSKVLYLGLELARRIGLELYQKVSLSEPSVEGFIGEWVFTGAVFDDVEHDVQGYIDNILRGQSPAFGDARANFRPVSQAFIDQMLAVRAQVDDYLEHCLAEVLRHRPRIVGFTSTFQQQLASLALAKRIKAAAPDTFIVIGGANCEGLMAAEVARQFAFIDAAVSGEGDLVFPQLVERVLAGRAFGDLAGVNTRRSASRSLLNGASHSVAPMVHDMDALPYPDFDDFFEQFALAGLRVDGGEPRPRILFESSRGCWWGQKQHCTFCGLNPDTIGFRAKSGRRALDELLQLHARYPSCAISVTDNILDMKYFKDFVPELAARAVNLEIFYEVKANLRKDQVRMLGEAGIKTIQPGIESFSDDVLERMRKGVSALQNIQLLKWCKEYGVRPRWNIIWGFPGEPPDEYHRVAALVPDLVHLPPPGGGGLIRLDRFSPNFDQAAELGFLEVKPYPAYAYLYPFADSVVANLAYCFTYRYRDPRDVAGYTEPLKRQMVAWIKAHDTSDLFSAQKGDQLLIWDLRPTAVAPLTVLSGLLKQVYELCDAAASASKLAKQLVGADGAPLTAEDVGELMQPLLERHLVLRDGESYLSLAIPLGVYSPPQKVMLRFAEVLDQLGNGIDGAVRVPLPPTLQPRARVPVDS
jgi:ribosomal peptide maturation radical SAM protein 1